MTLAFTKLGDTVRKALYEVEMCWVDNLVAPALYPFEGIF